VAEEQASDYFDFPSTHLKGEVIAYEIDWGKRERPWVYKASCIGKTEIFFSSDPRVRKRAIALCDSCEVRAECEDYVKTIPQDDVWGIWCGKTREQRKAERRG